MNKGTPKYTRAIFAAAVLASMLMANCNGDGDGDGDDRTTERPRAAQGVLDLRKWDFKRDGITTLDGQWSFGESRFLKRGDFAAGDSAGKRKFAQIPRKIGDGFGTYHLRVLMPPGVRRTPMEMRFPTLAAAVRVTADDREIWKVGKIGETRQTHASQYRTGTVQLPTSNADVLEITMNISYFGSRTGGPWKSVELGRAKDVLQDDVRAIALDIFLCGSIFVMSLYHLGLFLTNRRDRASLIFAFFCLDCFVRLTTSSQFLIGRVLPDFPWGISHRANYLSFYLGVPLFMSFLTFVFHEPRGRLVNWLVWPLPILATLFILLTPTYVYPQTLTVYQLFTIPCFIIAITLWIRAIIRKESGARTSFAAGLILIGAVANDLIYSNSSIAGVDLTSVGLFTFILGQSYVLAVTVSRVFVSQRLLSAELEKKAAELTETNRAFARFVPMTFFAQLGKTDVRQVELGDQTQADMHLLFSDIRSFTEISESMSPRESFEFLNSYLRRVTPLILGHGGFVEKYIGDAIMALFPDSADNIVRAAVQMQLEIRDFNRRRLKKGYVPIQAGIGLHVGTLMLGTIGAQDRMDGTVISSAVGVVQRIEAMTKAFGTGILASEAVIKELSDPNEYKSRLVGKLGRQESMEEIRLYEVLDGRPDEVIELFMLTRDDFDRGIQAFEERRWRDGEQAMRAVLAADPGDLAAKYYLDKLETFRRLPSKSQ